MRRAEQGDILKIAGLAHPILVVSTNFFNESGRIIACPIVKDAVKGPLHIPLAEGPAEGFVLCEQVKYLDLSVRRFSKLGQAHYYEIMDITDAIMGIFDYQQI